MRDQNLSLKDEKLSDVLKRSKKNIKNKKPEVENELSFEERCFNDRLVLSNLTLDEFKEGVRSGEIFFNPKCETLERPEIKFWSEKFYSACSKDGIKKTPGHCEGLAFFMKAQVMYEGLEDTPIDQMSDQELIYGFFSQLNSPKMVEIIQELDQRFPNSPAVAKAVLAASPYGRESKSEMIDRLSTSIGKAIHLNPDDKELMALDMYLAVETGEKNVEQNLNQFNEENPDSGEGFYALAFLASKSKDKDIAIDYIQAALKKDPNNQKFKEAYKKLQEYDKHKKHFSFSLGFRPEDF